MPSVKKHPVSFVFTLWRGDSCQQCIRALWSRENVPEQHKYVISFRFPSYYVLPNDVTDIPHSRIEVLVCLPWDLQCRFRILLWSHQSEKCHNKILKCDFGSEKLIDNSLRRNQKTSEKSHLFLSVVQGWYFLEIISFLLEFFKFCQGQWWWCWWLWLWWR